MSEEWREYANCRGMDPEQFFPERGQSIRTIKRVCEECDVREPCLMFAIENNIDDGWWGGMGERGRRRFKRELRKYAAEQEIQKVFVVDA